MQACDDNVPAAGCCATATATVSATATMTHTSRCIDAMAVVRLLPLLLLLWAAAAMPGPKRALLRRAGAACVGGQAAVSVGASAVGESVYSEMARHGVSVFPMSAALTRGSTLLLRLQRSRPGQRNSGHRGATPGRRTAETVGRDGRKHPNSGGATERAEPRRTKRATSDLRRFRVRDAGSELATK